MSEDEVFVFIVSLIAAAAGTGISSTARLHHLYFRGNPGPGVVRLGVLGAMAWIVFVLGCYADPSVTGIYVVFYLVMGYAVVKCFGQGGAALLGLRTRVDAGERRNAAAAILIAVFTLATGLIFGGSLWGDADPVGEDEGGWWIPVTFFLLGWLTLVMVFVLYQRRDGRLARRVRRERRPKDARAAAAFLLAAAASLTDAVAGDFWGWRHGIFSFGLLAVLLLVHESFAAWKLPDDPAEAARPADPRRVFESLAYLALAAMAWTASRYVDTMWGPG